MSTTIVSVFILLASQLLPLIGVTVGTDQLTNAVQTAVAIITGLVIWYRRVQRGDVTTGGFHI